MDCHANSNTLEYVHSPTPSSLQCTSFDSLCTMSNQSILLFSDGGVYMIMISGPILYKLIHKLAIVMYLNIIC